MVAVLVVCALSAWIGHAVALSRVMARRGFHPLPWTVVTLFLGPVTWPLAFAEAAAGLPHAEIVRRGRVRPGLHVLVLLDRDELPDALERQVRRLLPDCGRLVLARVIRTGGPLSTKAEAVRCLERVASLLGAEVVERRILYGTVDLVADAAHEEGEFAFVFRSDEPRELYDGGGQVQTIRRLRGSSTT